MPLLLLESSVKREVCSGNIKSNFMSPENASCSQKVDIISSFVFWTQYQLRDIKGHLIHAWCGVFLHELTVFEWMLTEESETVALKEASLTALLFENLVDFRIDALNSLCVLGFTYLLFSVCRLCKYIVVKFQFVTVFHHKKPFQLFFHFYLTFVFLGLHQKPLVLWTTPQKSIFKIL